GFFGKDGGALVNRSEVEDHCNKLIADIPMDSSSDKKAILVVRAGKEGCYIHPSKWLPAYLQDNRQVVDPTGGGNAFLGGFAITLAESSTNLCRISEEGLFEGACAGNVAASLVIEQVGIPVLGKSDEGSETWNGVVAQDR